jgi:Fe-S-cluster formation regulator IscX/YfhJ
MLEFVALERLYAMLEEMTDDAKRCGKLIISLARKEA